jgi:hypothetical protein
VRRVRLVAQGEDLLREFGRERFAFVSSLSVITTIFAPTSATSPQGKPWPNEIESTPSLPSSDAIFATKLFIGSTGVRHMSIMRQSWNTMTGLISPRAAAVVSL